MMFKFGTFNINKKTSSAEEIEREFEMTRNNYLKEIEEVRKRYESKLLELASQYQAVSL